MKFKNHGKRESGLSRLYSHMQKYDSGCITAYRSMENDNDGNILKEYTATENKERNKHLLAKLIQRYGVTSVKGSYIEHYKTNPKEVGESVFFVIDINETGNLEKDLRIFGQKFNQDSVLFIPKGQNNAQLIGTKKDEYSNQYAYPKFGQDIKIPNAIWDKDGKFITRMKGRPFVFQNAAVEIVIKGFFSRLGLKKLAEVTS